MSDSQTAPTSATDDADTNDEHSTENTSKVLEDIRTLIREDTEGGLDLYTKVTWAKPGDATSAISVKLDDDDTNLSYTLTITPIED